VKVFISWSGELSRSIAQALRNWLPMVVQHVEAWMSEEDIGSGGRWNEEIAAELERADYGIICLTSSNFDRPWLLFEAGALAKRFDVARVVPLLIDLKPADVRMPLASFQGRRLSEDGMRRLIRDMNAGREQPLPAPQIDQLFASTWPMLEARVNAAKASVPADEDGQVTREPEDVMAELIETVRRIERRMDVVPVDVESFLESTDASLFSGQLTDAIAQLQRFSEASEDVRLDRHELKSIVRGFKALFADAERMGFPVRSAKFRQALEVYRRRYGLPDT
jgi:hypothetical protein